MSKHIPTIAIFCTLIFSLGYSQNEGDSLFPLPDNLKANVAFWKKIYTEVSLKEGLIHDRDNPLVIFEKVTDDVSSNAIKSRKEKIIASITRITTQPQTAWTERDKEIYSLYITKADSSALTGATERVRFQQGQMERYKEGLKRSGMYIDTIRAIFKQYGVPPRLAYLPHVESSFNTEAYSKVGAAGLWQFMRGTGKLYGMKIDYTIDERRDPLIATIAAAKYLSSSYKELNTWPLAITSYNHGVYGMKRAVAQTGSKDIGYIIQNYSSKSFQFASSNFYGCFLAASHVADNYQTYFPGLQLNPPVKVVDLVLDYYVDLDVICKYFNVPREILSDLNPAIRTAIFEQHKKLPKGTKLHLPAVISLETIKTALAAIPDSLKTKEPERPQYYRVNKGDNLAAIALRLSVPIKELALENNITKNNLIRAGQLLRIPGKTMVASRKTPEVIPTVALASPAIQEKPVSAIQAKLDSNTVEAVVEIAEAEAQTAIPPEEASAPEKQAITVVIPNVTVAPVKLFEKKPKPPVEIKVTPKVIEPSVDELTDSLKDIALATAITEPVNEAPSKQDLSSSFDVSLYNLDAVLSPVGTSAEILVSIDETIGHYAEWLKIPTSEIRKLNDMGRTSDIKISSKLLIPVKRQDALETFVADRLEYHLAIEEDFYTQFMVTELKPLVIKKGHTLWDFCNDTENPIPQWLLKKYNKHLDFNKLMPGTTVWIPVTGENTGEQLSLRKSGPAIPNNASPINKIQIIKRTP